jgi:hypothetical protein
VANNGEVAEGRTPLPRPRPLQDEDYTDSGVERRLGPSPPPPGRFQPYDPPLDPESSRRLEEANRTAPSGPSLYERLHNFLGPSLLHAPSLPDIVNKGARYFWGDLFFPIERYEREKQKELDEIRMQTHPDSIGRYLRGPEGMER